MLRNKEGTVFAGSGKPFSKSWEEWTSLWWQWTLSKPSNINPGIDDTGTRYIPNPQSEVLFLVGTYGGFAVRSHAIPNGKAILFPVINFITSYAEEPLLKTERDLITRVKHDIDDIANREVYIDGYNLNDNEIQRVAAGPFDLVFPENNVFGAKSGLTRAAADGFWVFLRPLSRGYHSIRAAGACSSGKTKVDITWHLKVE